MKRHYLIRLDDACPTMNHAKWQQIETILDRYSLKPMVGVIPHNEDSQQMIDAEDADFWNLVMGWEKKGWSIALHGYNHVYCSDGGLKGVNPMWSRSEFAGLSLAEQMLKIRKGVAIMREHGINPKYFFAPSHTFDENTLNALREESDIRIISDTIATRPYRYKDFVIIPQFGGLCREIRLGGLFTFCLHPNTMSEETIEKTALFVQTHHEEFLSFDSVRMDNIGEKTIFDRMLTYVFFTSRKIRGLR